MPASSLSYLVGADGLARALQVMGGVQAQPSPAAIERILGLREHSTRERLSVAVAKAIQQGSPSLVLWPREEGRRLLLAVRAAREPHHAIVSVEDLDAPTEGVSEAQLVQMFGLARSEAEIALALARDASVGEIAKLRGVQVETVRCQIKSLLRKMGLNGQKQLVRVVTRLSAVLA